MKSSLRACYLPETLAQQVWRPDATAPGVSHIHVIGTHDFGVDQKRLVMWWLNRKDGNERMIRFLRSAGHHAI
jgi:hypothetical protein